MKVKAARNKAFFSFFFSALCTPNILLLLLPSTHYEVDLGFYTE